MKTHSNKRFVGLLRRGWRPGVRRSRGAAAIVASVALLLIGAASSAHAALMGDTVIFDNVSVGLWGTPTVDGDQLVFAPLDFRASQAGGPGIDFVAASVAFDVWAQPGYQITGIQLAEEGDSFLLGDGRTIVDGSLTAGTATTSLSFPMTGNVFVGPGGFDFANPGWDAEASIGFGASPKAHLHVVLENELMALAPDVLDVADINKALATLDVTTLVAVPEPMSTLLVGTSVGLLVVLRRRRRDS